MSEQIDKLAAAFCRFQAGLTRLVPGETARIPTKSGGRYEYKYADLASGFDHIRAGMAEAGLAVLQPTRVNDQGNVSVETILVHSSGQWLAGQMAVPLPKDMQVAQATGAAVTYARRIGLWSMVGISVADEDDDGAAAASSRAGQGWNAGVANSVVEKIAAKAAACTSNGQLQAYWSTIKEAALQLPANDLAQAKATIAARHAELAPVLMAPATIVVAPAASGPAPASTTAPGPPAPASELPQGDPWGDMFNGDEQ